MRPPSSNTHLQGVLLDQLLHLPCTQPSQGEHQRENGTDVVTGKGNRPQQAAQRHWAGVSGAGTQRQGGTDRHRTRRMPRWFAATCARRSDRLSRTFRAPAQPGMPSSAGASSSLVISASCAQTQGYRDRHEEGHASITAGTCTQKHTPALAHAHAQRSEISCGFFEAGHLIRRHWKPHPKKETEPAGHPPGKHLHPPACTQLSWPLPPPRTSTAGAWSRG